MYIYIYVYIYVYIYIILQYITIVTRGGHIPTTSNPKRVVKIACLSPQWRNLWP